MPTGAGHTESGAAAGLQWGSVCITGNFRDNNEDSIHIDAGGRFFLVADGMGGQSAGEKASALAIELVGERLTNLGTSDAETVEKAVIDAVAYANVEIMALGNLDPKYSGMGTTIVFAVPSSNGALVVGNLGDSRVYKLTAGDLAQVTKDHSLTQALIDAGTISPEEARTHRYKNMLFKYLGTKEGNDGPETHSVIRCVGDRLMLCSDGVTDGINDAAITDVMHQHADPQQAAGALVDAALEGGSRDNITCVVLDVKQA